MLLLLTATFSEVIPWITDAANNKSCIDGKAITGPGDAMPIFHYSARRYRTVTPMNTARFSTAFPAISGFHLA